MKGFEMRNTATKRAFGLTVFVCIVAFIGFMPTAAFAEGVATGESVEAEALQSEVAESSEGVDTEYSSEEGLSLAAGYSGHTEPNGDKITVGSTYKFTLTQTGRSDRGKYYVSELLLSPSDADALTLVSCSTDGPQLVSYETDEAQWAYKFKDMDSYDLSGGKSITYTFEFKVNKIGRHRISFRSSVMETSGGNAGGVAAGGPEFYTFTLSGITNNGCERFYGENRWDTMQAISRQGWSKSYGVVIASGDNWPDALAASYVAGQQHWPILLTKSNTLSEEVASEIKRLGASYALVAGGPSALSSNIENQLKAAGIKTVKRVYGNTRQETALKLADYKLTAEPAGVFDWSDTCIIATSNNYADALAVAPYAYSAHAPIFLTNSDGTLSDEVLAKIKNPSSRSNGYKKALIVGGTNAVSSLVESQLKQCGVLTVERKGGDTRYETSALVATWAQSKGMEVSFVGVATGSNFADALAGAALCGKYNSVLILADDANTSAISNVVAKQKSGIDASLVFGGLRAVSSGVEATLKGALQ